MTKSGKAALALRIEYARLRRALEYAIEERDRRVSTSWSIQQAMQHEVEMERVRPARGKLDEFVADLIAKNERLETLLHGCVEGWWEGNDIAGPMHRARAELAEMTREVNTTEGSTG